VTELLDTRHLDASAAGISCKVDQSWAAEELLLVIIQAGLKNFAVSFARENRNAQGCAVISARLL